MTQLTPERYLSKLTQRAALLLSTLALIQLAGCGASSATTASAYQKDAAVLCEAYNRNSWKALGDRPDQTAILTNIQRHLLANLETTEFKEAIEAGRSSSFDEYHRKVGTEVSSILGQHWNCPAFDDFYLPSITVVSLATGAEMKYRIRTDDPSVVYAEVFPDGTISLNRSMLSSNEAEAVENALDLMTERAGGSISSVIVGMHDSAPATVKELLLQALESRGIDEVFLVK